MKHRDQRSHIHDWNPTAGHEPTIRIGVVLNQDAQETLQLRTPPAGYEATGLAATAEHVAGNTNLIVRLTRGLLAVRVGDAAERVVQTLYLACCAPAAGGAADGALVQGVIAGRGFHWQKPIDVTLAGTLELCPGERGIVLINELPLEDYLAGVITAEMSAACPVEMLKAQCVVARSWLLAMSEDKHAGEPFDRCNDDCCQRYQGAGALSAAALDAVRTTRGVVLLDPAGEVLDANYAKSCGGISELPRAVWGRDKPGLSAVVDAPAGADEHRFFPVTDANLEEYLDGPWLAEAQAYCSPNAVPLDKIRQGLGRVDEVDDYFRWTVTMPWEELERLVAEKVPEARELTALRDLRVVARGVSGRASALDLEWEDAAGRVRCTRLDSEYRIREVLHRKFLYSSAFVVRIARGAVDRPMSITLRGAGWGHGVGLCQIGALGMALSGHDYAAICRHYYPSARLASVYE